MARFTADRAHGGRARHDARARAAEPQPTADTPVSHRGTFGPHALIDGLEYPGATCRYDGDQNLARVQGASADRVRA